MSGNEKVLTDSKTLRELAERIGKDELLDEMETAGISRWTANEMLKGTYKKALRGLTQKALLEGLGKHGLTKETLFRRAPTRSARAS